MAVAAYNRMPRKPGRKRKISICLGFTKVTKSLAFCYIMCFILRFLCSSITSYTIHKSSYEHYKYVIHPFLYPNPTQIFHQTQTKILAMNASYIVTIQTAVEIFFRPIFGFAITKIQNPNNILLFALAALLLAGSLFLNWFIEIINGRWPVLIAFSILQGTAFAFCGGLPTGRQA